MKYVVMEDAARAVNNKAIVLATDEFSYNYTLANQTTGLMCDISPYDETEPWFWYKDLVTNEFKFFLDKYQIRKWGEIKAVRDRKLREGFQSQSHWFASDDSAKLSILQNLLLLVNRKMSGLPTDVVMQIDGRDLKIKTLENGEVTFTYDGFETLLNDLNLFTARINNKALDKKAEMLDLENPIHYDPEAGFIATFTSSGLTEPTSLINPEEVTI